MARRRNGRQSAISSDRGDRAYQERPRPARRNSRTGVAPPARAQSAGCSHRAADKHQGRHSDELSQCCERGMELSLAGEPTSLVLSFMFGQFTFLLARGRVSEAISLSERFLSQAIRMSHDSARVVGHRLAGMAYNHRGELIKAKGHFERSLELYSAERDDAATHMFGQNTQVHSRCLLGLSHFLLGDVDEALQMVLDTLRSAEELEHAHSMALALSYVGLIVGLCGAPEALMSAARRLTAISEQHRLGPFLTVGKAFLGWALCQRGILRRGSPSWKRRSPPRMRPRTVWVGPLSGDPCRCASAQWATNEARSACVRAQAIRPRFEMVRAGGAQGRSAARPRSRPAGTERREPATCGRMRSRVWGCRCSSCAACLNQEPSRSDEPDPRYRFRIEELAMYGMSAVVPKRPCGRRRPVSIRTKADRACPVRAGRRCLYRCRHRTACQGTGPYGGLPLGSSMNHRSANACC